MQSSILKKGQIEIQESIFIVVIVIVLILIGLMFFYRYTLASIESANTKYEIEKFKDLISIVPNMPEFKCSFLNKQEECMDLLKVMAFKNVNSDLGNKKIVLDIIYPVRSSFECSYGNLDNCNKIIVYSKIPKKYEKKLVVTSPISLYNINNDEFYMTKLIIEGYI